MAVMAQVEPGPPADGLLASARPSRGKLDRWEFLVLAVFTGLSICVLAYDLWQAAAFGQVWTGSDGIFPVDQLQYMAWVRDASHHLLVSDMYVLRPTPHDYLEPLVALAGGLTALGMTPWAALLAFQPLAVAAIFFVVRAYLHGSLSGRWERRLGLLLALFFGSFVILFAPFAPVADEWIPFWTWGYLPGAFAIAAFVGALVAYGRAMRLGRSGWLAPTLGLLASWLHPWQGEELLLILLAYELGRRTRRGRRFLEPEESAGEAPAALPWLTTLATMAPLVYYVLLDRLDPVWEMARTAAALGRSPGTVLLPLVPLLVGAAFGCRGRPRTFLESTSRLWPLAALAVYGLCEAGLGSTPLHAFAGITVPLSVLAVNGVRRSRLGRLPQRRWLGALFVVGITVPAGLGVLGSVPAYVDASSAFIGSDAQRALSYLADDRQPGGVLTAWRLGALTPSMAGRRTYIGENVWSLPQPRRRNRQVEWLFYQHPGPAQARDFVLSTGARFVLAPCHTTTDLRRVLAPLLTAVHRFGCATVYTVRLERPGPNRLRPHSIRLVQSLPEGA